MKKSITLLALLAGATGLYAQGTIELTDYGAGFSVSVWSPQNNNLPFNGDTANDTPSGSVGIGSQANQYNGVPLGGGNTGSGSTAYGNGALWSVGIYAAPGVGNTAGLTAAETTGQPIAVTGFFTSGGTGVANDGTAGTDTSGVYTLDYNSTVQTALPGYSGGATFQLLAWYNGGVTTTLANADAQYAGSLVSGESTIESIASLGGNGAPAATVGTFDNNAVDQRTGLITSFALVDQVPEPSTIALGVIGASTFLFRRRK